MVLGDGIPNGIGLENKVLLGVVVLGKAGRAPKSNEFELGGTKVFKCNDCCCCSGVLVEVNIVAGEGTR